MSELLPKKVDPELPPPIPLEAIMGPMSEVKIYLATDTLRALEKIGDECCCTVRDILTDAAETIIKKYYNPDT